MVIIGSTTFDKNNAQFRASFKTKVYSVCGDVDAMSSRGKYIFPALKFFWYLHLKKGSGNGTKYVELSIQF